MRRRAGTCAEPGCIATCPLPAHRLRNGHLNQMAYSLYLFVRDVANGDLVEWIDDRVAQAVKLTNPDRVNVLIEPLRNVYGISDKVLALGLSDILIGAAGVRPAWLEVGVQLIAVDTLVHNFLHRTGILQSVQGSASLRRKLLPARRLCRYHPNNRQPHRRPAVQPGLPQRLSPVRAARRSGGIAARTGLDICNGNRLDDRHRCQNRHCQAVPRVRPNSSEISRVKSVAYIGIVKYFSIEF